MTRRSLAALLPAAAGALLAQNRRDTRPRRKPGEKRPPDLNIAALKIQRENGIITLDGTVRSTALKPLDGVVLFFEFLEPGGKMISRMIADVTTKTLNPGDEGEFLSQTPDQVRAVHVRLDAEDAKGRYLILDKPGPYVID
ncbi:MAG: hypothetical protein FJW39_10750 [Acidobacteria bacterium]|nr:hypothetical protein [Acidobacteriota bacterium]